MVLFRVGWDVVMVGLSRGVILGGWGCPHTWLDFRGWCRWLFRVGGGWGGVTYLLFQGHDGVNPDRALLTGIRDPH